jgi:DeoR/GlpR family transcriptional regulator of sugar metabolism
VYGGAVLQLPEAGSFINRKERNLANKDMIAQACVGLITSDSCIFIDSGTTNLAIARALPEDIRLTAVTNSPAIAVELMKHPQSETIVLGGRIQKASGGSLGSTAVDQLRGIIFDQAFIGACAMAPETGLTGFDFEDCEFKKVVIKQSNQVVVALTAEKVPGVARYVVADISEIDVMVVEESLRKEFINFFKIVCRSLSPEIIGDSEEGNLIKMILKRYFRFQQLRYRAAGFGFLNDFFKYRIINARQLHRAVQCYFSDGESAFNFIQRNIRCGIDAVRRKALVAKHQG